MHLRLEVCFSLSECVGFFFVLFCVVANYECVISMQNSSVCFSMKKCFEFEVMAHAVVVLQEV